MKRIVCLLLLTVSLLALASCKDGGYKTYNEGNIEFTLPKAMTERSVNYADICYSDGSLKFMAMAFSNERIKEELKLYEQITVTDYVNLYMSWNGYTASYTYDEENNCVSFDEITVNDLGIRNYEAYRFYRREGGIYVIWIYCIADEYEGYKEEINKIMDSVRLG